MSDRKLYSLSEREAAVLIAHAPTGLAALLAEIDRLRGQITEARDGWCRVCDRVCMG